MVTHSKRVADSADAVRAWKKNPRPPGPPPAPPPPPGPPRGGPTKPPQMKGGGGAGGSGAHPARPRAPHPRPAPHRPTPPTPRPTGRPPRRPPPPPPARRGAGAHRGRRPDGAPAPPPPPAPPRPPPRPAAAAPAPRARRAPPHGGPRPPPGRARPSPPPPPGGREHTRHQGRPGGPRRQEQAPTPGRRSARACAAFAVNDFSTRTFLPAFRQAMPCSACRLCAAIYTKSTSGSASSSSYEPYDTGNPYSAANAAALPPSRAATAYGATRHGIPRVRRHRHQCSSHRMRDAPSAQNRHVDAQPLRFGLGTSAVQSADHSSSNVPSNMFRWNTWVSPRNRLSTHQNNPGHSAPLAAAQSGEYDEDVPGSHAKARRFSSHRRVPPRSGGRPHAVILFAVPPNRTTVRRDLLNLADGHLEPGPPYQVFHQVDGILAAGRRLGQVRVETANMCTSARLEDGSCRSSARICEAVIGRNRSVSSISSRVT